MRQKRRIPSEFKRHNILIDRENVDPSSYAANILLRKSYYMAVFRKWMRFRHRHLRKIKREKGDLVCHFCGKAGLIIETSNHKILATLDHLLPVGQGGEEYDEQNLVVACWHCNQLKGSDPNPNWGASRRERMEKKRQKKREKKQRQKERKRQNAEAVSSTSGAVPQGNPENASVA